MSIPRFLESGIRRPPTLHVVRGPTLGRYRRGVGTRVAWAPALRVRRTTQETTPLEYSLSRCGCSLLNMRGRQPFGSDALHKRRHYWNTLCLVVDAHYLICVGASPSGQTHYTRDDTTGILFSRCGCSCRPITRYAWGPARWVRRTTQEMTPQEYFF